MSHETAVSALIPWENQAMPCDFSYDDPRSDRVLDDSDSLIRRSVLPGGVRLLTEADRTVRSASIGLYLPVGSRDEKPEHAGSTHFLEHLLFKGTARRSALDIATAFDEVGGDSNAVTAKEHTLYYGRVRNTDVPLAVDVLADMVTSSLLREEHVVTEREVILEELAMADDDPSDVGNETFMAQVLGPNTPVGRPVGGTVETVTALDAEAIRAHYAQNYRPDNLVVSAVGDLDHDELAAMFTEQLRRGGWSLEDGQLPAPHPLHSSNASPVGDSSVPAHATDDPTELAVHRLHRTTEQNHIFLGGPGINATSADRHTMSVLMSILGGGMSSRLFQSVREQRGLAYSVYSFSAGYRSEGVFGMYAACRPSRTAEVAELLGQELTHMGQHGVRDDEMRRALGQITGAMALGLEDTGSRMARLGALELVHGRYVSVDEALASISAVTAADVQALAARLARSFTTRVEVGPEA